MSEVSVVDVPDGRKLAVKEVTPSGLMSIMEACGRFVPSEGWMRYAMLACSVQSIDDIPVPKPTSKAAIEHLADKLGNAGIVALSEHFYPGTPDEEAGNETDAAKN
ncbi:hypothetical protein GOB93_14750 [Acetobacter musti]|uniref:Phage protein n=1 Tax=Acetobacter musti TaxID=864732 RepID=A0ABX0JRE3_9PROT|nr:hypothetical protein [Acetobacter musti]NHN85892.1 hypothetical protein [Acetobacter musti]